jgi:DnaJ-domain-containing protein 1
MPIYRAKIRNTLNGIVFTQEREALLADDARVSLSEEIRRLKYLTWHVIEITEVPGTPSARYRAEEERRERLEAETARRLVEEELRKREETEAAQRRTPKEQTDVIIRCPRCEQSLRFIPPLTGRKWKCKSCLLEFSIKIGQSEKIILDLFSDVDHQEDEKILGNLKWYDVLGVLPSAPESEIRKAYIALIKQYHPDKVASLGKELQDLAQRKTQILNQAFQTGLTQCRRA